MTAQPPALEMRSVRKRFGATVALDGVSLEVAPGECHALLGENGAGKSTLMRVLAGVVSPDAGEISLDGARVSAASPGEARRRGIAMIHQELALAPHLSVMENLYLGAEPRRRFGLLDRGALEEGARRALAEIGRPELDLRTPVGRLDLATRQLVEVARAVAVGCRVLVLDEPTSSLARPDILRLFELIRGLRARKMAIIYISHFIEEVEAIADRYTVLRDGRTVSSGALAATSRSALVADMVGREPGELFPRSPRRAGEKLLEITDLAGSPLPRCASLSVHRGEVVGIAGLVGAGRSELVRTIFGLARQQGGTVRVASNVATTAARPASPSQRWHEGVGLVSEDRKGEGLMMAQSVAENMTLTRLAEEGRTSPLAKGTGSSRESLWRWASRRGQVRAAQTWIDALAIRCRDASQPVVELSGGNQQKVALARLLHHDCDLLLLDEPTRGIDVGAKAAIYRLMDRAACGELGRAPRGLCLVSSDLFELLGVCDRVAVMTRGRLGAARPVGEWSEHELMMEATG